MDELFEAWTWTQLGLHRKPCALLNQDGYYDPLLAFLDRAVEEGFLQPRYRACAAGRCRSRNCSRPARRCGVLTLQCRQPSALRARMELITWFIDLILHLDKHLTELVADYHLWVYAILFLIIFCETGLVVTPFLPGDSLLFAVGALAAVDQTGTLNATLGLAAADGRRGARQRSEFPHRPRDRAARVQRRACAG